MNSPWTLNQVYKLNSWQKSTFVHPFTCGNDSNHILVATTSGWICSQCEYVQYWTHDFMLNVSQFSNWGMGGLKYDK